MILDPIHRLPLVEKKIGALNQAAPLAELQLPTELEDRAPLLAPPEADGESEVAASASPTLRTDC